jgi:hypothetical protein
VGVGRAAPAAGDGGGVGRAAPAASSRGWRSGREGGVSRGRRRGRN